MQKRRQTTETLAMAAKDRVTDLNTNNIPALLVRTLSGLIARRTRRVRTTVTSSDSNTNTSTEDITIARST